MDGILTDVEGDCKLWCCAYILIDVYKYLSVYSPEIVGFVRSHKCLQYPVSWVLYLDGINFFFLFFLFFFFVAKLQL